MISRQPHISGSRRSAPVRSGQIYSYGTAHLAQPTVRRIPARFKLVAFVLLALFVSGHFAWAQHASAQAEATRRLQQQEQATQQRKAVAFRHQVESIITDHPELSLQVSVAPQSSPDQLLGDTGTFDAASTAKLLTAATILHRIDSGSLSLTTRIDGQTVQDWLRPMIIESDDTAWAELNDYLGHDALQDYAGSIGIRDYDAEYNTMRASDVSLILQKIYDRQLLSNASRSLLLSYLSAANYRDFATAAVPASDRAYHKIGMDEDNVHDALIIAHGNRYVVLTIYSNGHGIYNWDARKSIMQAITKAAMASYL